MDQELGNMTVYSSLFKPFLGCLSKYNDKIQEKNKVTKH